MSWTDERVELLRKLWNEGLSASQVAAELGTGVTRNAVIGKIHRLGLAERAKTPSAPRPRAAKAPRSQQPAARTSSHSVMGNVALALSPRLIVAAAPRIEEDVVVPMSARVNSYGAARVHVPMAHGRSDRLGISLLRGQISRGLRSLLQSSREHRLSTRAGSASTRTNADSALTSEAASFYVAN